MPVVSVPLGGMVLRVMCTARLLKHAQGMGCAAVKDHAYATMHIQEQAAPCALTACIAVDHLGALCHAMA